MTDTPPSEPRNYESLLRRVGDLPSLPDVVNRILELLVLPNTSAAQLAQLISYDPGLTSKFLRMVNSAAYGFQRQISSVQHALMILGFSTVRGVVLSASIFKMFEARKRQGLDPTDFWRHSIATAIGARVLATKWNIKYADDAFTAGLLHDIGKMIMDYHFTADYTKVLELAQKAKIPAHGPNFLRVEQHILETDHAEIGYSLALRWKLPATLHDVIRYHHNPGQAEHAPELAYVVALANAFNHITAFNFGVFNAEFIPEDVRTYFNYDPENPEPFEALYKEVNEEMDGVDELLTTMKRA